MDFEKNPLMNDTSRCRREVKRWLALVALTLAALLTGMVSAVTAPSPEAQEIANFLMIASVTAIICSLFGIRQCNDHCRSVQYGLSVFEAMKKDLEGNEIELEETRGRLYEAENELAQTQECLYRTENVLEETRDWVCETDDALVQTRDRLDETEDELASVKFELSKAKLKLRLKEVKAQRAERCYESLREAYSKTMLKLLEAESQRDDLQSKLDLTNRILCDEIVAADNALYDAEALQSERDDLQSKLATARRFVRRLLAERNKLRYELTKARIGFGFFRREYVDAEARVAYAQQQIKDLESAVEARDNVIGSLLDDVVIRTKG